MAITISSPMILPKDVEPEKKYDNLIYDVERSHNGR